MPDYKFSEDRLITELKEYVDATYEAHYSGDVQPTELIISGGNSRGFCVGNIIKYAHRYGKKNGPNRQDILKILHYAIILLHSHDNEK